MFGITYKTEDGKLLPMMTDKGTIKEFLTYDEANTLANHLKTLQKLEIGSKYRVISLESVGV